MSYLANPEIALEKRLAVSNAALAFAEACFAKREAHAVYAVMCRGARVAGVPDSQNAWERFAEAERVVKLAAVGVEHLVAQALEGVVPE